MVVCEDVGEVSVGVEVVLNCYLLRPSWYSTKQMAELHKKMLLKVYAVGVAEYMVSLLRCDVGKVCIVGMKANEAFQFCEVHGSKGSLVVLDQR